MDRSDTRDKADRNANWLLIGAVGVLLVLGAVGGVLTVGDHLSAASPVLGVVYYAAVAVVVAVGVAYPLFQISRRPVFCLYQLEQSSARKRRRYMELMGSKLLESCQPGKPMRAQAEQALAVDDAATVATLFEATCKPLVDARIKLAAKRAFLTSVIARGALVEALTMLSLSLDLVRGIVEECGFRPNKAALGRLYVRVMASALIAGGVEDMDLNEVFGEALGSGGAAKASGLVLGATTDGLVGAYLVFRIGVITRDCLFAKTEPRRETLRRESFGEAAQLMKDSGFLTEMGQWMKAGATDMARSAAAGAADAAASAARTAADAAKGAVAQVAQHAHTAATGVAGAAARRLR